MGMTRRGLWELRKNVQKYGMEKTVAGTKRDPLPGGKIWNKIPEWIEKEVEKLWYDTQNPLSSLSNPSLHSLSLDKRRVKRTRTDFSLLFPKEKGNNFLKKAPKPTFSRCLNFRSLFLHRGMLDLFFDFLFGQYFLSQSYLF